MPFDADGTLLADFRTWQCTNTGEAAAKLTKLFHFNVPLRWSVSHYYQALLNGEAHVTKIHHINTLAGYIHHLLSGELVVGIGEASGMFPVDPQTLSYDANMMQTFNDLIGRDFKLILPRIAIAGEQAGKLTAEGASLLDPTGTLEPGCVMAPPEGDAGTGMVATNAISPCTGNVSAGTSIFSMVVLEKSLQGVHEEIDVVATPTGKSVAMVHCNNCTRDLNYWVGLFGEAATKLGANVSQNELYTLLFNEALKGEPDCNGVTAINYVAGEPVTKIKNGTPMVLRQSGINSNLADFMRATLYSAIATLKIGNDILINEENVQIVRMTGHGGYFKTAGVGQQFMADALNVPITCLETAGEGGPWGMAILASYAKDASEGQAEPLDDFLQNKVFCDSVSDTLQPDSAGVSGINSYIVRFKEALRAQSLLDK